MWDTIDTVGRDADPYSCQAREGDVTVGSNPVASKRALHLFHQLPATPHRPTLKPPPTPGREGAGGLVCSTQDRILNILSLYVLPSTACSVSYWDFQGYFHVFLVIRLKFLLH
ncbi:hypothetical protein E2C01_071063 [Portunus trituberculatus]|uniref:Uncharacterized protein n=1 Tax=Portunus trituberculatus TaxID=210409 RepID=A0A5B7I747_PORTR|nr:hypothetical protein [Portunus trituberculatus]